MIDGFVQLEFWVLRSVVGRGMDSAVDGFGHCDAVAVGSFNSSSLCPKALTVPSSNYFDNTYLSIYLLSSFSSLADISSIRKLNSFKVSFPL